MRRKHRVRLVLATLVMVLAGLLVPMAGLSASGQGLAPAKTACWVWQYCGPYLQNNKSPYWVPLNIAPTLAGGWNLTWVPNGTKFDMRCWIWGQNYTGNYTSAKWFRGISFHNGGWFFVHSSYVFRQRSVPVC